MYFLNPSWLYSGIAILIPVVIHLWKQNQGKTLKVGSISLISEGSRSSKRSLRLHDLFILLVRILIILFLTFFMAHPVSNFRVEPNTKTWVLLPKYHWAKTYFHFQKTIDSLQKLGAELHYLDTNFSLIKLKDLLSKDISSEMDSDTSQEKYPVNYWEVLNRLKTIRSGSALNYIYSDNGLSHFKGNLPEFLSSVNWMTYTSDDSISHWIDNAWFIENHKIKVLLGSSIPSGTFFKSYTLDPLLENPYFSLAKSRQGTRISLSDRLGTLSKSLSKKEKTIPSAIWVDSMVHKIQIISDKKEGDYKYLLSVLKSVLPIYPGRTELSQTTSFVPSSEIDWIFWLKNETPPGEIFRSCHHVFTYATGNFQELQTWLIPSEKSPLNEFSAPIHVYRSIPNKNDFADKSDSTFTREVHFSDSQKAKTSSSGIQTLWKTAIGEPLLTAQKGKNLTIYTFYSRFDPEWSDLVWNENFPALIMDLLSPLSSTIIPLEKEKRILAGNYSTHEGVVLHQLKSRKETDASFMPSGTLDFQFWIILILCFLILLERILSNRKFKAHGFLRNE